MMNNKYLIFFDIDGTLTPPGDKQLSKELIKEISRLKKDGHILTILTGRSLKNSLTLNGIQNFNYCGSLFGSIMYDLDTKTSTKNNYMNSSKLTSLIDYLIKNDMIWSYKNDFEDKTICNNPEFMERYHARNCTIEELKQDLENDNIYQILVKSHLPNDIDQEFCEFSFYKMPDDYYDITAKNMSKKIGVDYLKSLYPNLPTISFGDSNNDIEMLKNTDISISMANSNEEIKKITTYTTKSCIENGVVYSIKEILKI